jgi:hypothetical protein
MDTYMVQNDLFDVKRFLDHIVYKYDIPEGYSQTIQLMIQYGLQKENEQVDQFVSWFERIVCELCLWDILPFASDTILGQENRKLKDRLHFLTKEWVLASTIMQLGIDRVDCGAKKGLYRCYRIEVCGENGSRWLLPEYLNEKDVAELFFNDSIHLNYYKKNKVEPTGRICFMGYYRLVDPAQSDFINNFQRIDDDTERFTL